MGQKVVRQNAVAPGPSGAGPTPRRVALLGAGLSAALPLYAFLLLGDLVWSLKERGVQELVKAQLREVSQDALLLNILFGALPALLALFVGPLVGAWSDRTRTRLGRRIPFLLACALMLAASLVGLAFAQPLAAYLLDGGGAGERAHVRNVIFCMSLFWAMFELFSITGNALFIALINDTVPHAVLGRFFGLFRIVSLAVGAAFFYFVFGNDLPAIASNVMLGIAAAYLFGFLLLCAGVREPAYPPPTIEPVRMGLGRLRAEGGSAPWFYLLLFAALGIATICVLPVNINSYNAIGQFGVDRSSYGRAVSITYCISILLAWPLGWLADRIHPLRVGFIALVMYALSMLGAWQFATGSLSFLVWMVVHGVLAGVFLTGTASLLPKLLPRERFSELAAFSASVTALLTVVFTLGLGVVLDWSGRDFRLIFLAAGMVATVGACLWYALLKMHARRA
ncbi:MFS transporter [Pseudoduganella sp. UC29_106]|uniref:MFS transporter n=1 Tax=Pseudoduganella sp. UC29_106 TaxID=3374553 RepID=UPI003757A9E5